MSERTLSATVLAIFKTSTMSRQTPTFDVTYGMADPRTAIKSFAIHTTFLTLSLIHNLSYLILFFNIPCVPQFS